MDVELSGLMVREYTLLRIVDAKIIRGRISDNTYAFTRWVYNTNIYSRKFHTELMLCGCNKYLVFLVATDTIITPTVPQAVKWSC